MVIPRALAKSHSNRVGGHRIDRAAMESESGGPEQNIARQCRQSDPECRGQRGRRMQSFLERRQRFPIVGCHRIAPAQFVVIVRRHSLAATQLHHHRQRRQAIVNPILQIRSLPSDPAARRQPWLDLLRWPSPSFASMTINSPQCGQRIRAPTRSSGTSIGHFRAGQRSRIGFDLDDCDSHRRNHG